MLDKGFRSRTDDNVGEKASQVPEVGSIFCCSVNSGVYPNSAKGHDIKDISETCLHITN